MGSDKEGKVRMKIHYTKRIRIAGLRPQRGVNLACDKGTKSQACEESELDSKVGFFSWLKKSVIQRRCCCTARQVQAASRSLNMERMSNGWTQASCLSRLDGFYALVHSGPVLHSLYDCFVRFCVSLDDGGRKQYLLGTTDACKLVAYTGHSCLQ